MERGAERVAGARSGECGQQRQRDKEWGRQEMKTNLWLAIVVLGVACLAVERVQKKVVEKDSFRRRMSF